MKTTTVIKSPGGNPIGEIRIILGELCYNTDMKSNIFKPAASYHAAVNAIRAAFFNRHKKQNVQN